MDSKQITFKRIKELRQEFLNDTFAPDLPKRNKTHYEKWILKISNLLTAHRNFIVNKTNLCQRINKFPSNFNNLYDQEYELEVLRDDIQRWAWKRNWTFSDHTTHKLMINNID